MEFENSIKLLLVFSLKLSQLSLNQLSEVLNELWSAHSLESVSIKIVMLLMKHLTLGLLVHLFLSPIVIDLVSSLILEVPGVFSLKQYAFFIHLVFLSLIHDHAWPTITII